LELLTALMVRDMLHGASFDLELEEGGRLVAVDYEVGDELEDDGYRLLVTAHMEGVEDLPAVQELTEQVLEQLLDDAQGLVKRRELVAIIHLGSLRFERVPDEGERWDLVIPDWLAPDGAEVPFGFRPLVAATGEPWPTDEQLDRYGRMIIVPHSGNAYLFAVPAPTEDSLPVIQ